MRQWIIAGVGFACVSLLCVAARAAEPSLAELRAIAKEAYVYGYPIVDNYRVMYAYNVDPKDPEYKGPMNVVHSTARVYTPADKAIQTPNSDTPYSFVTADLRSEPIVLSVPPVPKERYYSLQFIDLYTFNFAYVGIRTTGSDGGDYLLAGPGWNGEAPKGVKQVIRSETELVLVAYRTQLFGPDDLNNVKKIQAGYKAQPLSAYLGKPAPPPAPTVSWHAPVPRAEERTNPEFFDVLTFALQFAPVDPSEVEVRARIEKLDGVTGAEQRAALVAGMADGQKEIEARVAITSTTADLFGTREYMKNDYVNRAVGAQLGIYGNSKQEAFYVAIDKDASGKPLDAAKQKYVIRFASGQLPPVNAFWSVTMYALPSRLLVANPNQRYLINSPMLPALKTDADGGIALYLQNESPGKDKEANWLPAPAGPFWPILRMYWPKPAVLDGSWKAPVIQAR
jgi:hypothetical protein